jgi:ubiquinone/menaquinone biosynthesis C-methylase UbiE
MAEFKLNPESLKDGIYFFSELNIEFENIYLKVRENENRIYSDEELKKLPFASDINPHKKEWDLRVKSFLRLRDYFNTKKANLNILDLGCGNCWLIGQLSKKYNHKFYCVDINFTELKQAKASFNSEQIVFIYADIFAANIPSGFFDIIILNAAVQYFPDIKILLNRLSNLLNITGEIHIIDTPFYSQNEVENARKRTVDYYHSIGFPEMADNYYHHSLSELSEFNFEMLYYPNSFMKRVKRLLFFKDSPFPWISIIK